MNWKKKRLVVSYFVAFAVLLVAVIAAVAYSHALKENPNFVVNITAPEDVEAITAGGGSYCYKISLDYNETKLPHQLVEQKNSLEQREKINIDLDALQNELDSLEGRYMIEADYENVGKKTVITFKGEVTDSATGALVPFERVYEYNFILTEKINKPDSSEYRYIK